MVEDHPKTRPLFPEDELYHACQNRYRRRWTSRLLLCSVLSQGIHIDKNSANGQSQRIYSIFYRICQLAMLTCMKSIRCRLGLFALASLLTIQKSRFDLSSSPFKHVPLFSSSEFHVFCFCSFVCFCHNYFAVLGINSVFYEP